MLTPVLEKDSLASQGIDEACLERLYEVMTLGPAAVVDV
jgi:hypothetical protein